MATPHTSKVRRCADLSEKGGVGKTNLTTGLAAVAADEGLNVVVVDGDPRGTATAELGVRLGKDTLTLNDLLAIPDEGEPVDPVEAIHDVLLPAGEAWPSNVRVIAGERVLAHRENDPQPVEGRLVRGLDALDGVDLVLMDMPPRPGNKLITALLRAATTVLIPATLTTDGYDGVSQAKKTMRLIRQSENPSLGYTGIIPTIVPRESELRAVHLQILKELMEDYPGEILPPADGSTDEYLQLTNYAVREDCRYACIPITAAPGQQAKTLVGQYKQVLTHIMNGRDVSET